MLSISGFKYAGRSLKQRTQILRSRVAHGPANGSLRIFSDAWQRRAATYG